MTRKPFKFHHYKTFAAKYENVEMAVKVVYLSDVSLRPTYRTGTVHGQSDQVSVPSFSSLHPSPPFSLPPNKNREESIFRPITLLLYLILKPLTLRREG